MPNNFRLAQDADDELIEPSCDEVWHESALALEIFYDHQTQWLWGAESRTGLNYVPIQKSIEWREHRNEVRIELQREIAALEQGCLQVQSEYLKKEADKREAERNKK